MGIGIGGTALFWLVGERRRALEAAPETGSIVSQRPGGACLAAELANTHTCPSRRQTRGC